MLTKLTSLGLAVSAGVCAGATLPAGAAPKLYTPKLYMLNNSQIVPGSPALLAYDHSTNKYATVANLPTQVSEDEMVDAAVVCGDMFYAVWAEVPITDGVLGIDMNSGQTKVYSNGGVSGQIFHALACGDKPGSLLALSTTPKSGGGLDFQLVSYDFASEATTIVGKFESDSQHPTNFAGFDNGFRFTADGKQLYATFPDNEFEPKIRGGSLHIMDTSSGEVTQKVSFPGGVGMPYGIYPNGKGTFKAAFMDTPSQQIKLCDIELPSGSEGANVLDSGQASVQNCMAAPWLSSGSAPMPVCADGDLYTIEHNFKPGMSQKLTAVDLETGATKFQVDMAMVVPGTFIGAMAC